MAEPRLHPLEADDLDASCHDLATICGGQYAEIHRRKDETIENIKIGFSSKTACFWFDGQLFSTHGTYCKPKISVLGLSTFISGTIRCRQACTPSCRNLSTRQTFLSLNCTINTSVFITINFLSGFRKSNVIIEVIRKNYKNQAEPLSFPQRRSHLRQKWTDLLYCQAPTHLSSPTQVN